MARFLFHVLDSTNRYEPRLVSLAMSRCDDASVRLLEPRSWFRGVRIAEGEWEGLQYRHVGTRLSELEFMRYMPRRPLTELLDESDLVQIVAGAPCWALTAGRCRSPVLLHMATLTASERERRHRVEGGSIAMWRRAMTPITARLDRSALRRVERVFVMTSRMLRHAGSIGGAASAVFAPPGVDVHRFRPRGNDDLAEPPPYILSVARFDDPRKNADLLFQAYGALRKRIPSSPPLWLAGASAPPESARKIARDLDVARAIQYLGAVSNSELAGLYRNAQFLVLSSDEEGFGLVLVEAMASGVPVVSTACGGPEEIVAHGEDGFLTPVGDAESLGDAMAQLVADAELRTAMGHRARKAAVERYSHQVAGERFLREYDALLGVSDSAVGAGGRAGGSLPEGV